MAPDPPSTIQHKDAAPATASGSLPQTKGPQQWWKSYSLLTESVSAFTRRLRSVSNDLAESSGPELLPLVPSYDPGSHGIYFRALAKALNGKGHPPIRNIALTGSYGTGKSSVLQQVARKYKQRVIEISLSTLGSGDDDKKEDGTPSLSATNRIQKEIVKQILYRADPAKTPRSRYRRIAKPSFWREFGAATLIGSTLTVVAFLAGWTAKVIVLFAPRHSADLQAHGVVLAVLAVAAFVGLRLLQGRLSIEKLAAGSTTISLSQPTGTFFDEYLDEIVYFFEATRYDIVIFEDIDRFEDPQIFETLRALNTILNGARQLKGRNVRFVYAMKDSIFDRLNQLGAQEAGDAASSELARANRTKFFDLVVPVVPFITHRNARDLVLRVMEGTDHRISPQLFDLVGRYVPDMRLITNARNEFVIFREKVLRGDGSTLGLSEDQLFAMMLYKGTHLADFERIRTGQSRLDDVYNAWRTIVGENIERLEAEEAAARKRASDLDSAADHSARLGEELRVIVDRQLRRMTGLYSGRAPGLFLGGSAVTDAEMRTADFWRRLAGGQPFEIRVQNINNNQVRLPISVEDLEVELGTKISEDAWRSEDRQQFERQVEAIAKERDFLVRAGLAELMARQEFTKVEGSERRSLRQVAEECLESELALVLVQEGFIDRNFTLYVSTYYAERVSPQARSFLIHNVDPNVADPHFALAPDDVEAILRERGESVLRERSMYNVGVLDHLLDGNHSRADRLLASLAAGGDEERRFLRSYIAGGRNVLELAKRLAGRWEGTFAFLTLEGDAGGLQSASLINAALEGASASVDYLLDAAVRKLLDLSYAEMPLLTSADTGEERASVAAALLCRAKVRLRSLTPLGPAVRREMVRRNGYAITRENLATALGEADRLALDEVRDRNPGVYSYAMESLPEYLKAIQEGPDSVAVRSAEAFAGVIKDVLEHAPDLLTDVVSLAAPECAVQDLVLVPDDAWNALAEGRRFPPTFSNVNAYVEKAGSIDTALAGLLGASGAISDFGADEDQKVALAIAILRARDTLPDAKARVDLVDSLNLKYFLPATEVEAEPGKLVGLLINHQILSDSADTFSLLSGADWPTLEFAIGKSEEFPRFMSAKELPASTIGPLMQSSLVTDKVKEGVLSNPFEFLRQADRNSLSAAADFALRKNITVGIDTLKLMAEAGVGTELLVRLLSSNLPNVRLAELTPLLEKLGGEYADLTARNGKRPRLPLTEANRQLVGRLRELGTVNSFEIKGQHIAVNMKRH